MKLTITYSKEGWEFSLTSLEGEEGDLDVFTVTKLAEAKATVAELLVDLTKEESTQEDDEHDPTRDFLEGD